MRKYIIAIRISAHCRKRNSYDGKGERSIITEWRNMIARRGAIQRGS